MRVETFDHTAKIYQFPKGGRAGLRSMIEPLAPAVRTPRFAPHIVEAGAWYHDEAIAEASQDKNRDH
ncbi:DUF2735 domain-containing protein [Aureimonas endophytica]|nr:DUF2735 domain-containing protein [Aureimonas endophytica]